jgi:hypothetical protein
MSANHDECAPAWAMKMFNKQDAIYEVCKTKHDALAHNVKVVENDVYTVNENFTGDLEKENVMIMDALDRNSKCNTQAEKTQKSDKKDTSVHIHAVEEKLKRKEQQLEAAGATTVPARYVTRVTGPKKDGDDLAKVEQNSRLWERVNKMEEENLLDKRITERRLITHDRKELKAIQDAIVEERAKREALEQALEEERAKREALELLVHQWMNKK